MRIYLAASLSEEHRADMFEALRILRFEGLVCI